MSALDKIKRINDICLYVEHFNESRKFFEEKFGFKVKRLQPDEQNANYCEFSFADTTVSMWERGAVRDLLGGEYIDGGGHPFMIAIRLESLSDVDDVYDEFSKRGVKCIKPPVTYDFGARSAYFLDYENNIWEMFAWEEGLGPGLLDK